MKAALALLGFALGLNAQVTVRFTPEPMAVPTAVLANARDLGRWSVAVCNDGNTTVSVPWERMAMAAESIRFVDPEDAMLVLAGHASKSFWATVEKYGSLVASGLSVGLALASKANYRWSTGLSIGSQFAPVVLQFATAQTPSIAPLDSGLKYPVSLGPGQCFTDHRFAAKMKGAKVVSATINLPNGGPPLPPSVVPPQSAHYELSAMADLREMAQ